MMTCDNAREAIELYFGLEELPAELQTHLAECDSCSAYYNELVSFAGSLGSDTDTPFTAEDFDQAVAGVAERIDHQPTVISYPARWLQPLLRVAAVLLVVGLSYGSYQLGLKSNLSAGLDSFQTADAGVDELTVLSEYDVNEEMDEDIIVILIDDYCSDAAYEATASLLDDISEEELEYLMDNIEVGEWL